MGNVAAYSLTGQSLVFTLFRSNCSQKSRSFVQTLVTGVSGGLATGFKRYDDAIADYFEAKARGLVTVVRQPGDDDIFGPRSEAEL